MDKLPQNFLQIMVVMDINVHALKHNVTDIIASVIVQAFIVLTAIAKIAIINFLKIMYQIDIQLKKRLNQNMNQLRVLVLKAVVIKIIVNVLKQDKNALRFVDVLAARIMTKFRVKNIILIINVIQRIVFIL